MVRAFLLLCFIVVAFGAHAKSVKAEKEIDATVIILGGAKTVEGLKQWRQKTTEARKSLLRGIQPSDTAWPDGMKSDEIHGLNPGFRIDVAGFCPHDMAQALLPVVRADYPGAYLRKVKVPASALPSCPEIFCEVPDDCSTNDMDCHRSICVPRSFPQKPPTLKQLAGKYRFVGPKGCDEPGEPATRDYTPETCWLTVDASGGCRLFEGIAEQKGLEERSASVRCEVKGMDLLITHSVPADWGFDALSSSPSEYYETDFAARPQGDELKEFLRDKHRGPLEQTTYVVYVEHIFARWPEADKAIAETGFRADYLVKEHYLP